jgi:hypothetical protein
MQNRLIAAVLSLMTAIPLLVQPVGAAGGGGGSDTTTECKQGEVWDAKKEKCVVPGQGKLDDDSIYEAGRDLAMHGRYGEAITVLSFAADKSDPRILNYLGYSHRMQGRVLVGLGYYEEALRVDPDYTLVREYMGEAHLQLGDVEGARKQLSEIEKRCGTGCDEYVQLQEHIDAFLKS